MTVREITRPGFCYAASGLRCSSGFTLIEAIVIIVVVSIAAVGLLGVFTTGVGRSADPMLNIQAVAIAQGYLEEAMLKALTDPDGAETGCEEASRALYDDVRDYDCVNDTGGALDQFGGNLAGLGGYNVNMNVTADTVSGVAAQRIDVIVTHDSHSLSITLTAYRM
ncbi:MAG TPA: prepilin-type N-terminal cleavage/methylation domain-containing protein [Gammaproteobacteria bacterium]